MQKVFFSYYHSVPMSKITPVSLKMTVRFFLSLAGYALYSGLFLLFLPHLGIGVNYLILIPICLCSYLFGLWGGLLSGALGLSCNMGLFYLADSLYCAPADLLIAQISGMVIGTGIGLAGSYIEKTAREIEMRITREEELKKALEERDILFKELNHRVKNNLNIMKGLIQLQMNRSDNGEFLREGKKLINRILSISLVHEQLYRDKIGNTLNLSRYLKDLAEQILAGHSDLPVKLYASSGKVLQPIPLDKAISVGLIINEVLTNSIKYAFPAPALRPPRIDLTVSESAEGVRVEVFDNGMGLPPEEGREGLGTTLIKSLTSQLKGECAYAAIEDGTRFTLNFPL